MKSGDQMRALLQNLHAKVESQSNKTETQAQGMLNDFELHLTQALSAARQKIEQDMHDLEKLSGVIHYRTTGKIENQALEIRQAIAALEATRKEWRTVTWKTMLPTYLSGVLLTFWLLSMAVHLTFPTSQTTAQEADLSRYGLSGIRVTRGLGGMGQVLSLPKGVELAKCPIPNPNGGRVCIETTTMR